jgi:molybdate transport system ATP-binding protein
VSEITLGDGTADIRIDCNGEALIARLTRYSAERLALAPGKPVYALIKSVSLDRGTLSVPLSTIADT